MDKKYTTFPVLKTERLVLRQLVPGDVNEIFLLRSDEKGNRYLDRKKAASIQDAYAFIETINIHIQKNEALYWGITLIEKEQLIGTICLFDFSPDKTNAEIGYELLAPFQGRGLMQEAVSRIIEYAFVDLQLHFLEAVSHPENLHSAKLLSKFNFIQDKIIDKRLIIYRLKNKYLK